jgi:hypothetical protein
VPESLTVSRRFNGPPDSGNGGYSSGIVANLFEGAAGVSLRRPVPLDARLDVVHDVDGSVRVLDGDALVAVGHGAAAFDLEVPTAVSLPQARLATGRFRGPSDGPFSRCFVCGRARDDTFGVFPGAVEGRELVASPWTPPGWTADATGRVLPEFVWAVLDCPTYFAAYLAGALPISMLAQLTARIDAPIAAGEEHIVMAWPIDVDGRKRHAGSAVLSSDGTVLARARALLIEPRDRRESKEMD